MEERLNSLEEILEVQNPLGGSLPKKPKFVERLDNNLIDLSAEFKQKTNDLNDALQKEIINMENVKYLVDQIRNEFRFQQIEVQNRLEQMKEVTEQSRSLKFEFVELRT